MSQRSAMPQHTSALTPSRNTTAENNMAARFPVIAQWWDPEHNNGVGAHEVLPATNATIALRCPAGHSFSGRGNNIALVLGRGAQQPTCPSC